MRSLFNCIDRAENTEWEIGLQLCELSFADICLLLGHLFLSLSSHDMFIVCDGFC